MSRPSVLSRMLGGLVFATALAIALILSRPVVLPSGSAAPSPSVEPSPLASASPSAVAPTSPAPNALLLSLTPTAPSLVGPLFALYDDGRFVYAGLAADGHPVLYEGRFDEADRARLVGLGVAATDETPARLDTSGAPATLTVQAPGGQRLIALVHDPAAGTTPGLAEFVAALTDIRSYASQAGASGPDPFMPQAYFIVVRPVGPGRGVNAAWPLSTSLPSQWSPAPRLLPSSALAGLTSANSAVIGPLLAAGPDGRGRFEISGRAALPHEAAALGG